MKTDKTIAHITDTAKPTVGFVQRSTGRYIGWYAFITGLPTYFGKTRKDCNEWIKSHGCDPMY